MASEATPRKKLGMGRGPNHVPKSPTNPDDRPLIRIRPPPESNLNTDQRLGKHLEESEPYNLNNIDYLERGSEEDDRKKMIGRVCTAAELGIGDVGIGDLSEEAEYERNLKKRLQQILLKKIDDRVKAFVQRYFRVYQEP
ncbi:hypothetical protein AgCh_017877 [Apium graveolens]